MQMFPTYDVMGEGREENINYCVLSATWVQERVKDMRDQLRNVDKQMDQLSLETNIKESQLQASLKKNDLYESAFDEITLQLHSLLEFQSGMIEHYEEEKRLTRNILERIVRARSPYNGGKHGKRRTVSDEGTHNCRSSAQMSQRLGSYNSAPTLKEATEEPQEESDFLLQQGLAHQHEMNGRVVSAHDTRQFPEITCRRQQVVSPDSPPPDSSISEIYLGSLLEDANSEAQGPPKSPLASFPDGPERDDGTRRRPSSAKEGGSSKSRSAPGTKGGSVYAQSVIPKKQK